MGNPYDYMNGALRAYEQNDPKRAYRIFSQILKFRPNFDNTGLYYWRAEVLFSLKRYHLALADIQKAIDLHSTQQLATEGYSTHSVIYIKFRLKVLDILLLAENDRGAEADQDQIDSYKFRRDADDELLGRLYSIVQDVPDGSVPDCCQTCEELESIMSTEVGDNGEIECLACNCWFIPTKPGQRYCSEIDEDDDRSVEYGATDSKGNKVTVVLKSGSPTPEITINGETAHGVMFDCQM